MGQDKVLWCGVRLRNIIMKPSQTHPQLAGNMASHSSHWDRMRSRSGKSFAMRPPRRQLGPSMIENPRTEPHDIPTSSYIYIASRRGCDSEGFCIFEHCSSSNLQHSRKRIWRATLKSKSSSLIRNYPTHQWYANDIVSASRFDPPKTSPSQPFSAPPWPRPNRQRPETPRSRRSRRSSRQGFKGLHEAFRRLGARDLFRPEDATMAMAWWLPDGTFSWFLGGCKTMHPRDQGALWSFWMTRKTPEDYLRPGSMNQSLLSIRST